MDRCLIGSAFLSVIVLYGCGSGVYLSSISCDDDHQSVAVEFNRKKKFRFYVEDLELYDSFLNIFSATVEIL